MVTGIVRRSFAGNELLANYPEWKGKFEFVVIEDYTKKGSFDTIFQAERYDHIVHTAAPMPNALNTDFDKHFLRPGVDGSLNLLNSANTYAPTVKSIAITGSANSITGTIFDIMACSQEGDKAKEYTNDMWSNIAPQSARQSQSQYIMYCSGKKETELAVWDWVKTKKPNFNVIISLIYHDGYDAS